jgi:PAS domain S-box
MTSRILIVDDDPAMLAALSGMVELRLKHIAIDTCESAPAALEFIGHTDYDAIVSDVKMPGMDGFQLMERVLKIRPTTPTLLVTGHGDHDMGVKALNAGAYAFIPKPIDRDFFIAWLKRAIQLRQLNRIAEEQNQMLERTVQERTAELERTNRELKTALEQQRDKEEALRASEARFRAIVSQATAGVAQTDMTGRFVLVNTRYCEIVGYSESELLGMRMQDITHPDDLARNLEQFHCLVNGGPDFVIEKRYVRKDGSAVWVNNNVGAVRDASGVLQSAAAVVLDITARRRAEQLLVEQKQVLELIAQDASLSTVCEALVRMLEEQTAFGMLASILLLDDDGIHLRYGSAPNLPEAYNRAIDGLAIGPKGGSCGTAAYRKEAVYVADIANDPLWADYAELALAHNLRACWSTPMFSSTGRLLGTLAMYYPEVREPHEHDLRLVEIATRTAAIAIERRRAEEALRQSEAQLEAELTDTKLLQDISAQLISEETVEALYEKILDAAIAIMRSDYGSMQMLYPERGSGGELRLLAFRGFNPYAAKFWEWVRADSESTCGQALRTGRRAIAPDVERCDFMAGTDDLATYLHTGIHAVQSTPLLSRSGKILGMISTHWREPYQPSERDLLLLDILARQAADLLERRQAEEAVRQRTAQFETLLNQAPLGVYLVDAGFRITQVNPTARPIFGDIPDLIGRDFDEVIHILWTKEYADEIVRIFRHTLETGEPYKTPERIEQRCDRGVTEYYEWRIDRIALPDGRYGVVCYFRDISAQVLGRKAIAESAERFRALVDAAAQIVWMTDANGDVVEDSPSWRAFTGQTYEEWKGRGWLDVLHTEDRERVAALWQKAVFDKTAINTAYRLRHTTGEWCWTAVRAVPLLNSDGSVYGWVGMNSDITDRKRAEEALRQNRERFDLVAEGAEVGFWFCDLPFNTLIWDHRVKEHFWLAPDAKVTIDTFYERLHPDDRECTRQAIAESIANKTRYDVEYRTVSPEGGEKWIRAIARTFYDAAGKPNRFDGVTLDVTPRKQAEEDIQRLLKEAQARECELREKQEQLVQTAKLASIGELASGVAHELNNPLNNIGLFIGNALDQLGDGHIDPSHMCRNLEMTLQQVKKASTIITHLRTFAHTASTPPEPVDMHGAIRSAVSLVEAQLRPHNIELVVDLTPDNTVVLGNATQLEQVFINLLTNARDAVEETAVRKITIRSAIRGSHVDVTVSDTGSGIPEDLQTRIFDPFFTTKDIGKGTGLGLSISYGIIQKHRGRITVESGPREGAAFVVTLPLAS